MYNWERAVRMPFEFPSWTLVLFKVSPSRQQSPLYVIYLTHPNVSDSKVQPVKFKPTNLPFPQLCADTDTHVWGKSKRTHMDAFMHAHEKLHANARSPFQSHSLLLFQNISCFHAATYASWMFASDIQINGAAKCATSVLLRPTLGGCTTLFSATSSQPSPGRQLRDKTIHCY